MGGATTVYLLRHAESQSSPEMDEPDWPLTERGRQQALDIVPQLAELGIDAIYSSPFPRAIDTVRPFADQQGLPIRVRHDLRERKLTDGWLPDLRSAIAKTWEDFQFAFPDGESSAGCQLRVVAAVTDIVGKHPGETLLVSSHGSALSLLLNQIDRSYGFNESFFTMKNPDLFRIEARDASFSWDRSWQVRISEEQDLSPERAGRRPSLSGSHWACGALDRALVPTGKAMAPCTAARGPNTAHSNGSRSSAMSGAAVTAYPMLGTRTTAAPITAPIARPRRPAPDSPQRQPGNEREEEGPADPQQRCPVADPVVHDVQRHDSGAGHRQHQQRAPDCVLRHAAIFTRQLARASTVSPRFVRKGAWIPVSPHENNGGGATRLCVLSRNPRTGPTGTARPG